MLTPGTKLPNYRMGWAILARHIGKLHSLHTSDFGIYAWTDTDTRAEKGMGSRILYTFSYTFYTSYTYMAGGAVQCHFFCSVSIRSIIQQKLKMPVYNYWPNIPRAHQPVPSSGTRSSGSILFMQGWECQVAQCVLWRRTISHLLLTHQASSSPLCSLSAISIGTGEAGTTAALKKVCSRGKTKAGKQKASR